MRISNVKIMVQLVVVTVVCGSTISGFASTDDGGKSEAPAKRVTAKADAPAPLTERERWLLDRVEELEKRVADLESKGNPTAASAEASAAQPASANAGAPTVAAAPNIIAGATPANSEPLSKDRVAGVAAQATEKGKSGAAKPQAAEPFSFADFTWLNGNSRTKDIAQVVSWSVLSC